MTKERKSISEQTFHHLNATINALVEIGKQIYIWVIRPIITVAMAPFTMLNCITGYYPEDAAQVANPFKYGELGILKEEWIKSQKLEARYSWETSEHTQFRHNCFLIFLYVLGCVLICIFPLSLIICLYVKGYNDDKAKNKKKQEILNEKTNAFDRADNDQHRNVCSIRSYRC